MIDGEKLTMHYGNVVALDDVSFNVEAGEILGLLGPNGAGKSTVMKILTTFLYPTSGTAHIGGHNVLTEPIDVRRMIGYLPEVLPLYLDMEVGQYLSFVGHSRGLNGVELRKRIDWVQERTGLRPMFRRPIRELSNGYQQRTALAQALIHDPSVIILDEATTGLDPHQITEIRKLIRELSQDKTVVFSTHILQEVEAMADRVVIINRGEIVAEGTKEELAQKAQEGARADVCIKGDEEALDALKAISSVKNVRKLGADEGWTRFELEGPTDAPLCADVFALARQKGWELGELKAHPYSMEETFLALTEPEQVADKMGGAA